MIDCLICLEKINNKDKILIKHSKNLEQKLYFIDSEEMLSQLPEAIHLKKIFGKFPDVFKEKMLFSKSDTQQIKQ